MKNVSIANLAVTFSEFDSNHDTVEIFVKLAGRTFCFDVQTNRSNPADIEIDARQPDFLALAEEMTLDAEDLADDLAAFKKLQALVVKETAQAYEASYEATALHKQGASADFSTYEQSVHCVHDNIQYFFIADDSTIFVRTTISELRCNSMPESVTIDDDEDLDRIESAIQDNAEDCSALFDELYAKANAFAA